LGGDSDGVVALVVERPLFYLVRDARTNAIPLVGRVLKPTFWRTRSVGGRTARGRLPYTTREAGADGAQVGEVDAR